MASGPFGHLLTLLRRTTSAPSSSGGFLLLEDGTSRMLLENGVDGYTLESGGPAGPAGADIVGYWGLRAF